jgi:hypothetical protein
MKLVNPNWSSPNRLYRSCLTSGFLAGGANYQVPIEVNPDRRTSLAIRWLVTYGRARGLVRFYRRHCRLAARCFFYCAPLTYRRTTPLCQEHYPRPRVNC